MSDTPQYPPPPPGGPYSPQGYGGAPAVRKSNVPAVASLILGILFCIPGITGLLAVVFGIVGIRKTRDPQVGGKGLAIAGLILGALGLLGWGFFGGGGYMLYKSTEPARLAARQFVEKLDKGDVAGAAALSADSLNRADLEELQATMSSWGGLSQSYFVPVRVESSGGTVTAELNAVLQFSQAEPKSAQITLTKENGQYKVAGIKFQ